MGLSLEPRGFDVPFITPLKCLSMLFFWLELGGIGKHAARVFEASKARAGDNKGGVVTCSLRPTFKRAYASHRHPTSPRERGEELLIILRRDDEACADASVPAPA